MSGQEPAPKFTFRRVEGPKLQPDLSNISEITTTDLRQAIARDGGQNIRSRLVSDMVHALSQGNGVDTSSLPEPLI